MKYQTPKVRIVVLNYAGSDLLPQCLPSIVEAAQQASYPTQITILDNPSEQDGLSYVQENYPSVQIWKSTQNRILCSYNDYLPHAEEPVVILLNNDIRVAPDFVDPLVERFKADPKTFMAAPRVMNFDGTELQAGQSKGGIRFGFFWCDARYRGYQKDEMKPSRTISSGFGAFHREKFLKLGGYDDRYLPGILEDVDLCFRARKAGYTLYYEPTSVVYHMGQASFKRTFGVNETSVIAHRNNFLFMWKNFRGLTFWIPHVIFLPLRLLYAKMRGNQAMIQGFQRALELIGRRPT